MQPATSDRAVKDRSVHFVCMFEGECLTATIQSLGNDVSDFKLFASQYKMLLEQPLMKAVVVIQGYYTARVFDVKTFRWLCGVGPHPEGKDENWMGG